MDNNPRGIDPEVKRLFKKILRSVFFSLLWVGAGIMAGINYKFGIPGDHSTPVLILFYAVMAITLVLLIRYLYYTWKDEEL